MSGVPSSTSRVSPTAPFADAGRRKIEYRASIQCVRVRECKSSHSHFFFMRAGGFEGSAGSRNLVMARESSLNSTGFVTYELKRDDRMATVAMLLLPSPYFLACLIPIFVGHMQIALDYVSMERKRQTLLPTSTIE
jgi:hypothetical protein